MSSFKRSAGSISVGFYALKTIFPLAVLVKILYSIFLLILLSLQADKSVINAGDFSDPLIIIILGGIFSYRLTGIAAANSMSKDNTTLSAMICSIPVGISFAAIDIFFTKILAVLLYNKPVRHFFEQSKDYIADSMVCTINDTDAVSKLSGLSALIYLWAFLAGCIVGMFIINKCRVRLVLTAATSLVSLILMFKTADFYIASLLLSPVNPLCFVYGGLTAIYYAFEKGEIVFNLILLFLFSVISITANLVLIKPNIPQYKRKRKF